MRRVTACVRPGHGSWVAVPAAAVLLTVLPASTRAQSPAGPEFRINAYTTGAQGPAAVAVDQNGDFVVAWLSYHQDGDRGGIFGRRFSAIGTPLTAEFPVNAYTSGNQRFLDVASDPNGNFVAVWASNGEDGDNFGVFGRRFGTNATPQAGQFRANSYTTSSQVFPVVTRDAGGNFVVVWNSYGQDGHRNGIFGQAYDAAGVPQGPEFPVNSYTTGQQFYPDVTADNNGSFVVIWEAFGADGSSYGISGRRIDAAGTPQGSEFQVNVYTVGAQSRPAVASDAAGNFVVVWSSSGQDGNLGGVFGRRFAATGVPLGGEFAVNSYTTGNQSEPHVAVDSSGDFMVVWVSTDGNDFGIFGQRFDAAGAPVGGEFQVNSYTTGRQWFPYVGTDPDGDFVVVWFSVGQDGDGYGVFGQRYGDLVFQDGFESGGFTRWSSVATGGGSLLVGAPGALADTTAGMIAFVTDTDPLFVQDDTPAAEDRYRARFYFDPNSFDPGESQGRLRIRLLIAFDGSNQRLATIVLRRLGGTYSIRGRVRLDDGTRADTPFFSISDAPHFIEFDWQRSSAPGANDGLFTLRIDDLVVSTLNNLDNDSSAVEFARMGALAVKTGASGVLFFDQFESRRQRFIGPE